MEQSVYDAQRVRGVLSSGKALLFDGATGTYARELPGFPEGPVELCCLTQPQRVLELHRAYLSAGCRAIKTNTFAAHVSLAVDDGTQQREVIRAACALARQAADGSAAAVFADIGPAPAQADAARCYTAMAQAFLDEGMTCFLLETMHSAQGLCEAAAFIRARCPEAFIAVSFAADADGFTRAGEPAASLIAKMDDCPDVDAVGLNCICGAYHMRRLLEGMKRPQKQLIAMPNAGYPHVENGRTYYDSDPAYFARQAAQCRALGASLIGGCCGTTPEHIRRLAAQLKLAAAGAKRVTPPGPGEPVHRVCRSSVKAKLDAGGRVILVELDPPRSADIGGFVRGAQALYDAGADAITIADCPIGRARMDSSLLACKLKRELGVETLPHMTCRDRNLNATKALLLGLSMEGVHNVLLVTGDPIPTEERDEVKSVFNFNSRKLARYVTSLNSTVLTSPFRVFGALDLNAKNFDIELRRAQEKEENGVVGFLTQPVLSAEALENLKRARETLQGKLLGGIFPVVSHRNACFLNNEISGMRVCDEIIDLYAGKDRDEAEALAVTISTRIAQEITPYTDGLYIMTPFRRVELIKKIIEAL